MTRRISPTLFLAIGVPLLLLGLKARHYPGVKHSPHHRTGNPAAARFMREADLVICVGTRLTDFSTSSQSCFNNPDVRKALRLAVNRASAGE